MRRVAAALLATGAAALAACGGGSSDGNDDAQPGPAAKLPPRSVAITSEAISKHLRALQRFADQDGGTREAGSKGERLTAEYVAAQLRAAGWRVRFQTVPIAGFSVTGTPVLGSLAYREDFAVLRYSPTAKTQLRPRPFDTFGCRAAELGSLTEEDLAIVNRGTCTFREKALAAQEAGAGGLAVVDEERPEPVPATLGDPAGLDIPVFAVTGPAARDLATATAPVRVELETAGGEEKSRNVIAESPGSGPVVMAGAHLDSVAAGPGINDDGSGIVALLAIAAKERTSERLRFGFWTGEELGLFGSRRYAGSLTDDQKDDIRGYLNLDMVGSPNARTLIYGNGDRMKEALEDAFGRDVAEHRIGAASDHWPFEQEGIPTGGIYTGGDEPGPGGKDRDPCYHRACDTVKSVDAKLTARMARVADEALAELAGG